MDLNTVGVEQIWSSLYCLDDPKSVTFQGSSDLDVEQTLSMSLTACTDPNIDCVTELALVEKFLKDRVFLTITNQLEYQTQEYEENNIIQKKAVVKR